MLNSQGDINVSRLIRSLPLTLIGCAEKSETLWCVCIKSSIKSDQKSCRRGIYLMLLIVKEIHCYWQTEQHLAEIFSKKSQLTCYWHNFHEILIEFCLSAALWQFLPVQKGNSFLVRKQLKFLSRDFSSNSGGHPHWGSRLGIDRNRLHSIHFSKH